MHNGTALIFFIDKSGLNQLFGVFGNSFKSKVHTFNFQLIKSRLSFDTKINRAKIQENPKKSHEKF